ncbi:MAG TPA: hypothetical protein VGH20_09090 [Myxococcales bacterium]
MSEPLHEPRRPHIDARFAKLRVLLPAQGEIGYLSDDPPTARPTDDPSPPGTQLYEEAQFALAPLILRNGDDTRPVVVAQVRDADHLDGLAREHGLRIAVTAGPHLAILRR